MKPHPEACPKCGEAYGKGFHQNYQEFNVVGTVYGDPKTVGQQAELNAKRWGKEQMQRMAEEERTKQRLRYTGKLPEGATPVTEEGATPPWRDGSMGVKPMEKPLDLAKVKDTTKYIATGEM